MSSKPPSKRGTGLAPPASSRAPIKKTGSGPSATAALSSSSSAQRRAMTERRHQMANTIRKARRGHVVARKRRCGGGGGGGGGIVPPPASGMEIQLQPTSGQAAGTAAAAAQRTAGGEGTSSLVDLASAYVRAASVAAEASSLSAFQAALARGGDADVPSIDSLLKGGGAAAFGARNEQTPALLLVEALVRSLTSPAGTDEVRMDAARVLTNLAATGGGGGGGGGGSDAEDTSYYGATEESWTDVIARSSALRALVGTVDAAVKSLPSSSSSDATASSPPPPLPPPASVVALCEQCCWALGNVAGDSQRARDACNAAGAIRPLVGALRVGFGLGLRRHHASGGLGGGGDGVGGVETVGLCRNAAWALSNLARGAHCSSLPFLDMGDSDDGGLLRPRDLAEILAAPELLSPQSAVDVQQQQQRSANPVVGDDDATPVPSSTWTDCANEASWILAFLTAREDEAVDYLVTGGDGDGCPVAVCEALACRLSRAADGAGSSDAETAEAALRAAVPCIRSVGNIAAACDGRHVPRIVATAGDDRFAPVTHSLAKLIQLGAMRGRDYSSVAAEAAWAAGALLVDAGRSPLHPSTVACATLGPVLCEALTSGMSKLELKREAASALCNAIAAPPGAADVMESQPSLDGDSLDVRNEILNGIAKFEGIIPALTSLLLSYDADAVYVSVTLVDALLRRLGNDPNLRRLFEEAGIVDALETVCDRASSSSSYGQHTWQGDGSSPTERGAEISADLIDDFFSDEAVTGDEDWAGAEDPTYTFSPPVGGFDFSGTATLGQPTQGAGRGRGRGQNIPAWMSRQQQQQS